MGSRFNNFLELFVNEVPFSINDGLIIVRIFNTDFSVFFFGLQFEFEIENADFGGGELFGLLFETGIREGFFEGYTVYEERFLKIIKFKKFFLFFAYSNGTSGNHFDTNEVLIKQISIKFFNCLNNQF